MGEDKIKGLPYQDTRYSWFVLAASAGMELLYASGVGTIGVLIVQLTETFNVKKSALTWVGGLLLFSGFILGFIPSALIKRYGCRPVGICAAIIACGSFLLSAFAQTVDTLYLSHGILASIALCTFFNIASISGQQYFHRYRSLAAGVTMASISAGILIWPPACQLLINAYGWRGALIIMAGIQLHGIVFAMVIRPVPNLKPTSNGKPMMELLPQGTEDKSQEHKDQVVTSQPTNISPTDASSKRKTNCDAAKTVLKSMCQPVISTPHYIIYLIGIFLIQTGHIVALSMLPLLSSDLGISKTLGASLLSILGGTGGVARTLFGFVGDWKKVNRSVIAGSSGLISGLITCGMGYLTSYSALAGITGLLGVTSAAYNTLQGACVIDYVGRDQMAPGVGLLSIAMGFGRLTAMLVSGAVLDLLDSPKYVFILFGLVEATGGLMLPLLALGLRLKKTKNPSTIEDPS